MPVLSYVHPTFKGVWRSSAYFVQLRVMHTTSVHGNHFSCSCRMRHEHEWLCNPKYPQKCQPVNGLTEAL